MVEQGVTRWAVLGTGVVSRKFVQGLQSLGQAASVVAVASRDPQKAVGFAKDFGIQNAAADYAAAVNRPDVDAVYIATPPSEHEAHALLAIAARKAVLIEKPFALNAAAARRVAAAADTAGVFCMEAMWTRFLPLLGAVRQKLAAGDLGEVRSFQGSFLGSDVPDHQTSLFDPLRGGGALMHRGIYPLSLARHLLGPIEDVIATGRIGATGVDEDCTLVLRHQSGAISTISASLRAIGSNDMTIHGTAGMLQVFPPIFRPWQARLSLGTPRMAQAPSGGRLQALRETGIAQRLNQALPAGLRHMLGRGKTIRKPYDGNGYHYEAAEVAQCMARGEMTSGLMPLSESIEIMAVIDKARTQFS